MPLCIEILNIRFTQIFCFSPYHELVFIFSKRHLLFLLVNEILYRTFTREEARHKK